MDKAAPQTTARAAPRLWPVNQSVGCELLESGGFGGGGLTEFSASLILSHEWRTAMAKPVWTSPVSGAPSKNHEKRAGVGVHVRHPILELGGTTKGKDRVIAAAGHESIEIVDLVAEVESDKIGQA